MNIRPVAARPLRFGLGAAAWLGGTFWAMLLVAQSPAQDLDGTSGGGVSLQSLVGEGLPVAATRSAATDLHLAAHEGDPDRVRALLDAGANVDAAGELGRTPLMEAVAGGHLKVASVLLKAGAGIHARDDAANTALFYTATGGDRLARLLLEHGSRAGDLNVRGQASLAAAALLGQSTVVQILLKAGAPVEVDQSACRGRCGRSAFAQAVLGGHFKTAELLLAAGARLVPEPDDSRSLLHIAAERGDDDAVNFLLSQGIEVDPVAAVGAFVGETPLLLAAHKGHPEVVRRLLAKGADTRVIDKNGLTPLQLAAKSGFSDVVRHLLKAGAVAEEPGREKTRSPPLVLAAIAGHLETVRVLLEGGAAPDAANRYRVTALMSAAYEGRESLVRLLLEVGADPNARSREGHTPLLYAVVRAFDQVVRLLLEAGAEANTMADIEAFGEVTPLMLTAGRGFIDSSLALLEHGAEVDRISDVKGYGRVTPLMLSAARGDGEVTKALLEHGADPSRVNDQGQSPQELAREAGHDELAALLERHLP